MVSLKLFKLERLILDLVSAECLPDAGQYNYYKNMEKINDKVF